MKLRKFLSWEYDPPTHDQNQLTIVHDGITLKIPRCILDTGSAGTTFEAGQAEKLGLIPSSESKIRFIRAVGGRESVYSRHVDRIKVGDSVMKKFEIETGDLHSMFGIDGIIGNDFLKNFRVEICYRTKTLSLV